MPKLVMLGEGETMAMRNRAELLEHDCALVANVVKNNPGVESKAEIARLAHLRWERVHECIRRINANETPYSRLDYGTGTATDGPHAGSVVTGWWPMSVAKYQPVMDQADDHSAKVERGVRLSRLTRLAFAHGLTTTAAANVVSSIERKLGEQIEQLSETDLDAFEALLAEELEA